MHYWVIVDINVVIDCNRLDSFEVQCCALLGTTAHTDMVIVIYPGELWVWGSVNCYAWLDNFIDYDRLDSSGSVRQC